MTPEQHEVKAARIERSLGKCTAEQYEIVIEGVMLAASHWFNFTLHRMKFTDPENDVLHAQYLSGDARVKLTLLIPSVLSSMDAIEALRPFYVRGDLPNGAVFARRALDYLGEVRCGAIRAKTAP